jgi:hypothetical protein
MAHFVDGAVLPERRISPRRARLDELRILRAIQEADFDDPNIP